MQYHYVVTVEIILSPSILFLQESKQNTVLQLYSGGQGGSGEQNIYKH